MWGRNGVLTGMGAGSGLNHQVHTGVPARARLKAIQSMNEEEEETERLIYFLFTLLSYRFQLYMAVWDCVCGFL